MKNVMILSCSTGQGHNSCAEAIREYFEGNGISCRVCEGLDFVSPLFSRFICWGHSFMYRYIPGLFRWGYSFNERHPALLEKGSLMYKLLSRGAERMYGQITAGGYDTVICTHMFCALILTRVMELYSPPVATAFVDTDYTCSPGAESSGLQMYFVPSQSLAEPFKSRVKAEHMTVATGIPVRREFWTRHEKAEAKEALRIGADIRHLLMMCGSMGCGPMVKLLRRIAGILPDGTEVTVICGTNRRLQEKLARRYGHDGRIHIVGYTRQVPLYMDSADLYLTKPGGISVTEAAAKGLPMAFIDPVSGCERYNMEYFVDMGAAITDGSVAGLAKKCVALLGSEDELLRMRRALEEHGQPNGAELIYRELGGGTSL